MYKSLTVRPPDGGDLVTHVSTDDVGPAHYTIKRDFRRDMDREVRREGHVLFSPVNLDSSSGSTGGPDSSSEGDVLGVVLFERQVEGGYAEVVANGNDDEHNYGEETGTNIGFYRLAFRLTNTGGVPVNLTISTVIADAPDEADTDYNFALVQINADPDEEAKPSTLAPLAVELDPSEVYEFELLFWKGQPNGVYQTNLVVSGNLETLPPSFRNYATLNVAAGECAWTLPSMADSSTPLIVNVTALASLDGQNGGSSDRSNTAPISAAMNEAGSIIALPSGALSSPTLPKVLVRNGDSFDVHDLTWPGDRASNEGGFYHISRDGAILGWYTSSEGPKALYWANRNATPTVLTLEDESHAKGLSPQGSYIFTSPFLEGNVNRYLAYTKTPNGTEFVIESGPFHGWRACNYCEDRVLTDWAAVYVREAGTDTWTQDEVNENDFLFDMSGDGQVAVGNDYGDTGLIFQGGQISTAAVSITDINGEGMDEVVCTRVSGDGSVVTGHYLDGDAVMHAFVWDATNGARSLALVASLNGLDIEGSVLRDVLWLSANGRHMLVRAENEDDRIYYMVLDPTAVQTYSIYTESEDLPCEAWSGFASYSLDGLYDEGMLQLSMSTTTGQALCEIFVDGVSVSGPSNGANYSVAATGPHTVRFVVWVDAGYVTPCLDREIVMAP